MCESMTRMIVLGPLKCGGMAIMLRTMIAKYDSVGILDVPVPSPDYSATELIMGLAPSLATVCQ